MCLDTCQVWSRFQSATADGQIVNLRIQDIPEHRKQEAIEFYYEYLVPEEPLFRSYMKKFGNGNQKALVGEEERAVWDAFLFNSCMISVCCSDDDDSVGEFMGISFAYVRNRSGDSRSNVVTHEDGVESTKNNMLLLGLEILDIYDPFTTFKDIDSFLDDMGIVVHPKYRRLGICKEFLRTRRLQCKVFGIDLTVAWMTTESSQRAAVSNGWAEIKELTYDDIAKRYELTFDNNPPTVKIMYAYALI